MIVAVHIASGALIGSALASRRTVLPAALASHALGDVLPHQDFESRRFEIACGVLGVLALAVRDGPFAATTVGAVAAAVPDLEHVLPLPRPGGRKLYPTHRYGALHRGGGVPATVQLACAVAVYAAVIARRGRP